MKKTDANTNIQELKDMAKKMRDERDWAQFHRPKELAIDMSIEAGELLELFLWKTDDVILDTLKKNPKYRQDIADELADVVHAALAFATVTEIDLARAVIEKIKKTAEKYPIEKAHGKAKKYTEL